MRNDVSAAAELVRSEARLGILCQLQEGDATRYECRDELDCARTTVDRNLDQLERSGWVRQFDGQYTITTSGEFAFEAATEFLETVDTASELQSILRWIPRDELDIDLALLSDAEVTLPGEGAPLAMVDKHIAVVEETSSFRAVLPLASTQPMRIHQRRVEAGEAVGTIIVTPNVAEVFRSDPQFVDIVQALEATEDTSLYVTEESVPYYLGILDGTVQIGVDENLEPRGLLETDREAVASWAERRFEQFLSGATPFSEWP